MTRLLVGHVAGNGVAHAVQEGSDTALCGLEVTATEVDFPGGASSVCRDCQRARAQVGSSVPVRGLGERKRPGGM